jgi:CRISPR system Cascade subunit CasD
MNTLLLRLVGPMQSWGVQSRFGVRDSGLEPSKSGVIGLLCAALGKPRDETHPGNIAKPALSEITALRMGVRVEREGILRVDYHTASNVLKASGGMKDTDLSNRYYLADAAFLVGLEGDDLDLLKRLDNALHHPVWQLFLGRKAFIPSEPIWLPGGLKRDLTLLDALDPKQTPCLGRLPRPPRLRLIIEDPGGETIRSDVPVSFADRRFLPRRLRTLFIENPQSSGDLAQPYS